MEYAIKKGVSLSTLRRHIKAKKVQYKVEHGRYLLFDESSPAEKTELEKAREEIAELRMLVALYEERQRLTP
jgi:hypothetical protein